MEIPIPRKDVFILRQGPGMDQLYPLNRLQTAIHLKNCDQLYSYLSGLVHDTGAMIWLIWCHFVSMRCVVMPPPSGAGCIMFSGCPSIRPSEAWNTLFPPVHGSVCPSNQPWLFRGMSPHPSVHPSIWRVFWAFAGELMEGITWNFACWCILSTFRTD